MFADIDIKLVEAALKGWVRVFRKLFHQGADVNGVDWEGCNAFMHACYEARLNDLFEHMVAQEVNINAASSHGWTALMKASAGGNVEIVAKLLSMGADPQLKTDTGITAIHLASPYATCAQSLIDAGADPNVKDSNGETPLMRATAWPDAIPAMRALLYGGASNNMGRTPLLYAFSIPGAESKVALLLERGADVHAPDNQGWNPLLVAVHKSETEAVRMLLAAGADPLSSLPNGTSALDLTNGSSPCSPMAHIRTQLKNAIRHIDSSPGPAPQAVFHNPPPPPGPHLVCGVCLEAMGNTSLGVSPMIASKVCGHVLCEVCWLRVMHISERKPCCPMCKKPANRPLKADDFLKLYV